MQTVGIHALAEAMTLCSERGSEVFRKTQIFTINPKAILSGELYGTFDENTHEWKDGKIFLQPHLTISRVLFQPTIINFVSLF